MNDTGAELLKAHADAVLTGWVVQYARWKDDKGPDARYVVVAPIGGLSPTHIRRPTYQVSFIGGALDNPSVASDAAIAFIKEVIARAATVSPKYSDSKVKYAEASEPYALWTGEGRPVFETIVTTTLSL